MVVLCAGTVSFFVRVLVALVEERISSPPHTLQVYLAKFTPRKQGELIVMNPEAVKRKLPAHTGERAALVALLAAGLALPLHGQQPTHSPAAEKESTNGSQVGGSTAQVPREILEELESMKRRIEQLEAQLKERSSAGDSGPAAPVATEAATAAASPNVPVVSFAGTPPAVAAAQSESTAAAKPPASEPFAFADWTWLNGNPRTKEAAVDSKFFTPEIRADVD